MDDMYPKAPSSRASGSPMRGVPAKPSFSEMAYKERLTMPEAIETVAKMLNAFPNARDGIRDGYMGVLAQLLTQYPKAIALRCADPIKGVTRTSKFLPTVAQAVEWMEREQGTLKTAASWDRRSREQLNERDQYQHSEHQGHETDPEYRKQVVDRIKGELRGHGFKFLGDCVNLSHNPQSK